MAELFGVLAEFDSPEALIAATRQTREYGYVDLDAFTPFPVPELYPLLRLRDNRVLWLGLVGGIAGFVIALAMQLSTNIDYPINVGGRPLFALSAFSVITFELIVLLAALTPAIGMLALNGLPRLHHPVFGARTFARASKDGFFLCVLASDQKFEPRDTAQFLHSLDPRTVELVTQS